MINYFKRILIYLFTFITIINFISEKKGYSAFEKLSDSWFVEENSNPGN